MGDSLGRSSIQTGADLASDIEQVPDREPFPAREHGRDTVALHVLHRGAELAIDLARAVKRGDIRGREFARALAFGDQSVDESGHAFAQRLQILGLERYGLVSFRVRGLVDQGSVGFGKLTLDFETAKHHRHCSRLAVTAALRPSISIWPSSGERHN